MCFCQYNMKLFSHWFATTFLVMWSYYIMVIKGMKGGWTFCFWFGLFSYDDGEKKVMLSILYFFIIIFILRTA